MSKLAEEQLGQNHPEWTRALVPMMSLASNGGTVNHERSKVETFEWIKRPEGGRISGRIYTDGSMLDGPELFMARCGWALVAINELGIVTAIARGVPPPWIDDIHGTEVWALVQASLLAEPGQCTFLCDCESVVTAVHEGMNQATSAKNRYARAYGILQGALDDTPAEKILWMPAHGKGTVKSDGSPVTGQDREANDIADTHAKEAVETHRLHPDTVEKWKAVRAQTKAMAMWTARVTAEANNHSLAPFRDSTASKIKGEEARRQRKLEKQQNHGDKHKEKAKRLVVARPTQLGGHLLMKTTEGIRKGWRCSLCKGATAKWSSMAAGKCLGSLAEKWAKANLTRANRNAMIGPGHELVLSGEVTWCLTCGRYAEAKAVGLTEHCKGVPIWCGSYGGAWGQLRKLQAGIHPRTGEAMEKSVGLDGRSIDQIKKADGTYSNLQVYKSKQEELKATLDGEQGSLHGPKAPEKNPLESLRRMRSLQESRAEDVMHTNGKTAKDKRQEMQQRVRAKEEVAKVRMRSKLIARVQSTEITEPEGEAGETSSKRARTETATEVSQSAEGDARRQQQEQQEQQRRQQKQLQQQRTDVDGSDDDAVPCGKCQATVPEPVLLCCRCLVVECLHCRHYHFCVRCDSWMCMPCSGPHVPECRAARPNSRIARKRPPKSQEVSGQTPGKATKTQAFDLTADDSDDEDRSLTAAGRSGTGTSIEAPPGQQSAQTIEAPPGRKSEHSHEAPPGQQQRQHQRGDRRGGRLSRFSSSECQAPPGQKSEHRVEAPPGQEQQQQQQQHQRRHHQRDERPSIEQQISRVDEQQLNAERADLRRKQGRAAFADALRRATHSRDTSDHSKTITPLANTFVAAVQTVTRQHVTRRSGRGWHDNLQEPKRARVSDDGDLTAGSDVRSTGRLVPPGDLAGFIVHLNGFTHVQPPPPLVQVDTVPRERVWSPHSDVPCNRAVCNTGGGTIKSQPGESMEIDGAIERHPASVDCDDLSSLAPEAAAGAGVARALSSTRPSANAADMPAMKRRRVTGKRPG